MARLHPQPGLAVDALQFDAEDRPIDRSAQFRQLGPGRQLVLLVDVVDTMPHQPLADAQGDAGAGRRHVERGS